MSEWLDDYDKRIEKEPSENKNEKIPPVNPKHVLKNYILQEAIEKA